MASKTMRHRPNRHLPARHVADHTRTTFVVGLDYDVKGEVHWHRAVTGILDGTYTPLKVHETKRVRSAGGSAGQVDLAWPVIVRLNYWVDVPYRRAPDLDTVVTRIDVLLRDGFTCAYCRGHASTVDHIHPESRGGKSSWGNLIAACKKCNEDKADRTPEEAGLEMLWDPRLSTSEYAGVQAEVWRILSGD